MNCRIFVEKKKQYQTEADALYNDIVTNLGLNIKSLRLINIYDVFNSTIDLVDKSKFSVFGEKVTDKVFTKIDLENKTYFAVEYLPGQFDQRADSAEQCLRLIDAQTKAVVKSGQLIIIDGLKEDLETIKKFYINEIEAREKDISILELHKAVKTNETFEIKGFIDFDNNALKKYGKTLNLAMSDLDLIHIQKYFIDERRNPTITEIKMLDTYWSDHCRHTTFETELKTIKFSKDKIISMAFDKYIDMKEKLNRKDKPITLMDMATINARYERSRGNLDDLEISEENNACSIFVDVDNNKKTEKWLVMFKNETHNHPTEIEPFGGASTCIGGAIRDPLSGRSYVYQAMRVTGAGDVTADIKTTIEGKLPQRVISKKAAHGYSSYGNQIGLATTHVREIYHEGYIAKRMEVGAVVGAVKADLIRRESPVPGDYIILLGGKTGRDGIGGATGSSKKHNEKSLDISASEVQKGNAPEERKIQRLFRDPNVIKLIKKANDFGAGGVSVAVGELADGIIINLDKIPVKYEGLSGTEVAISESQERMAVVVSAKDTKRFIKYANAENIEATIIAIVTKEKRLVMAYQNKKIVDISREFIETNGVRQKAVARATRINYKLNPFLVNPKGKAYRERFFNNLKDINVSMQKGLVEMFDASIGASTVLMPYGGKYQLTKTQTSVQKIPVEEGVTNTATMMAFGFNPYISKWSPYHGAQYSVVEALTKIVASGGDYKKVRFSFQEYFEKLGKNQYKWGKVTSALLGSVDILQEFGLASIGGKDSMSGTFKKIDVPPTMIAFGLAVVDADNVISPEFKTVGNNIYLVKHTSEKNLTPDIENLKANYDFVIENIKNKKIISAFSVEQGGISAALAKMSYGNKLGIIVETDEELFDYQYGSIIIETTEKLEYPELILLGEVSLSNISINGNYIKTEDAISASMDTFKNIYPTIAKETKMDLSICKNKRGKYDKYKYNEEEVRVVIPVFPGTNCDYDTKMAFDKAGGKTKLVVFRNTTKSDIYNSIRELKSEIDNGHILVLSGGFSSGDEPDGSGKFIANLLNNDIVKQAIKGLLIRDGLILGICNGFQALLKAGMFSKWKVDKDGPTLFRNDINRHVSCYVNTRVASVKSPWLSSFNTGDIHKVAVSHGEGKFVVTKKDAKDLFDKSQIAFQYVDMDGNPTMDPEYNINGSHYAIEGIISADGLILGKMGHSERYGNNVAKNISGNKNQDIFTNAIKYFKGE